MRHPHQERGMGREFGFGPGGPGAGRGRPRPRPGGPRMRRGDTRLALLGALADGPAHGYELIQRLEERTQGRWKPSPGSVYPTLQLLEEQGFVRGEQCDDKRVYSITEAGQTELATRTEEAGGPPWMLADDDTGHGGFRHALGQLVMASKQVAMQGDAKLVEQATAVLNDARRKLYALLAEA